MIQEADRDSSISHEEELSQSAERVSPSLLYDRQLAMYDGMYRYGIAHRAVATELFGWEFLHTTRPAGRTGVTIPYVSIRYFLYGVLSLSGVCAIHTVPVSYDDEVQCIIVSVDHSASHVS